MKKRLVSILLCIVMLMGMVPVLTAPASATLWQDPTPVPASDSLSDYFNLRMIWNTDDRAVGISQARAEEYLLRFYFPDAAKYDLVSYAHRLVNDERQCNGGIQCEPRVHRGGL